MCGCRCLFFIFSTCAVVSSLSCVCLTSRSQSLSYSFYRTFASFFSVLILFWITYLSISSLCIVYLHPLSAKRPYTIFKSNGLEFCVVMRIQTYVMHEYFRMCVYVCVFAKLDNSIILKFPFRFSHLVYSGDSLLLRDLKSMVFGLATNDMHFVAVKWTGEEQLPLVCTALCFFYLFLFFVAVSLLIDNI